MFPNVFVSIGSNQEREVNIRAAVCALRERFGELLISPVYETEAVGFKGDHFYNLVAAFSSEASPAEIRHTLREIEDRHGRERDKPRFSDRTLDLDLLLHGDRVSEDEQLPRGEILEQAYVLCPLADLAGERRHPVDGRTFTELWAGFSKGIQRPRRVEFGLDQS